MFHPLPQELVEGIELPQCFTNPFDYQPHELVKIASKQLCDYIQSRREWHAEIEQGKMFGVLVVENSAGQLGFLAAFSGYLDKKTIHSFFVPPIVNLLEVNGFFAIEEANISQINRTIAAMDADPIFASQQKQLTEIIEREKTELEQLRSEYLTSRAHRRELRAEGCDEQILAKLNAESQHQKGNLKRREVEFRNLRKPLEDAVNQHVNDKKALMQERQERSAALQKLTFSRFQPLNAKGDRRSLLQIFEEYNHTTPPAGSGECAAPKMLHYALANSLKPIAMGEFWWGESTRGEVRRHMHYYPACRGKCHPILSYMLQGLDVEKGATPPQNEGLKDSLAVIYEDDHMVVFNKPSGLPTVRGLNHTESLQSIAEERYPHLNPNNMIVHRLDMDTSGIVIIAKSAASQLSLQQQFAEHTIRKRYIAVVDGLLKNSSGTIDLPLILDPHDRPRQRVDYKLGKYAYTAYTLLGHENGYSRIALYPQTGRTHQLRVHCAHAQGLNMPIIGDRLYGNGEGRLLLHAEQITLRHPATQRKFTLRAEVGF